MKQFSLILNLVLLLAVGYLFYHTFSGKKSGKGNDKGSVSSSSKDTNCSRSPIAYVELDSMYEKITYVRDRRKELEAEQKAIESEWENGMRNLEAEKNKFIKEKGNTASQDDVIKFQNYLAQQQQQIEGKKQAMGQKLSEKNFSFMDEVQKALKDFLNEYNQEKKYMYILTSGTGLDYMVYRDPSLNITDDVIKGMNEKMKTLIKK